MIKSTQAEKLFVKGQRQARSGNFKDSINLFDQALELYSDKPGIYLHKALSQAELEYYSEAIETINTAIEMNPSNPAFLHHLGVIYYDDHQVDKAIQCFEESLAMAPDNRLTLCFKQLCYMHQNRFDEETKAVLLKNIQHTNSVCKCRLLSFCELYIYKYRDDAHFLNETQFYDAFMNKSDNSILNPIAHRFKKNYITIKYAFSSQKKKAFMHYLDGNIMLKKRNIQGAIANFKQALNHYPDNDELKYIFIDLYFYQKDFRKAYELMKTLEGFHEVKRALQQSKHKNDTKSGLSSHLQLIFTLGLHYFHINKYNKATVCFNLLAEFSNDYQILYYLGLCALVLNKKKHALNYFKQSVQKINPELPQARLLEMLRIHELKS